MYSTFKNMQYFYIYFMFHALEQEYNINEMNFTLPYLTHIPLRHTVHDIKSIKSNFSHVSSKCIDSILITQICQRALIQQVINNIIPIISHLKMTGDPSIITILKHNQCDKCRITKEERLGNQAARIYPIYSLHKSYNNRLTYLFVAIYCCVLQQLSEKACKDYQTQSVCMDT